jgi:hypothetical protein
LLLALVFHPERVRVPSDIASSSSTLFSLAQQQLSAPVHTTNCALLTCETSHHLTTPYRPLLVSAPGDAFGCTNDD